MSGAIEFRRAALNNGYRLVRVQPRSKRPIAKGWEQGETAAALLAGDPGENTGLLLDGLRAVDIDIDEPDTATSVLQVLTTLAPKSPLVRTRAGSTRFALIYRAAAGAPRKCSIKGDKGGLDILGAKNQIVVDGIHPSGVRLDWRGGMSPATAPLDSLPTISEECIDEILRVVAPILGALPTPLVGVTYKVKSLSAAEANAELSAGIGGDDWFSSLSPDKKMELVKTCLHSIDNITNDTREIWLAILFAVADAGATGCPNARDLALEWSRRGAGWTSEADFDLAWSSFRYGKITVGTLFHFARAAGVNITPWRDQPRLIAGPQTCPTAISGAIPISAVPLMPPKREWLHGTDLARGAVSLMVAPGGRGKSTWLTTLALATTSGRPLLGAHVFGGPLRVLYLNCEDSTDELSRRFRAAMTHHRLTDADLPGLMIAGADRIGYSLLRIERNAPQLDPMGWTALRAEVARIRPDVIMIDPLVAVIGGASLNDNTAAAMLMRELVAMAAINRCAIMVAHHTSKGSDVRSADAAMGAASLVNLARIALSLKTLSESEAPSLGVAPGDAASVFQILGTKQNLSRAGTADRWFRLVSVDLPNAVPPIYPYGDKIGVVELFAPLPITNAFSQTDLQAAITAIASAQVPLSPSPKAKDYAVPVIAAALRKLRGALVSEGEAKAVLGSLIATGQVIQTQVKTVRAGRGGYPRMGLVVAPTPQALSHGMITPQQANSTNMA